MAKGDFIGEFELYVLLAIHHLGDDAYGVTIREHIDARTGREVAVGSIYATLGRLHDKGLVTFRLSEPEHVQGGRTRKHTRLTRAGERAMAHSSSMMLRMIGEQPAGRRR